MGYWKILISSNMAIVTEQLDLIFNTIYAAGAE